MTTIHLDDFLAMPPVALQAARTHLAPFVGSRGAIPVPTPDGLRYVVSSMGHCPHAWELLIDLVG